MYRNVDASPPIHHQYRKYCYTSYFAFASFASLSHSFALFSLQPCIVYFVLSNTHRACTFSHLINVFIPLHLTTSRWRISTIITVKRIASTDLSLTSNPTFTFARGAHLDYYHIAISRLSPLHCTSIIGPQC